VCGASSGLTRECGLVNAMYQVPCGRKGVPHFFNMVLLRSFSLQLFWIAWLCMLAGPVLAQDEGPPDSLSVRSYCAYPFVVEPFRLEATAQANDYDGRAMVLQIQWNHHPQATDTLRIEQVGGQRIEFISNGQERWLWQGRENRYMRRLAMHHLRESIFDSPFLLDDLELLTNGAYRCQDSADQSKGILRTAKSMAWYSLRFSMEKPPSKLNMAGMRGLRREIQFQDWEPFLDSWIPRSILLKKQATIRITRMEPLPDSPARASVVEPIFFKSAQ